MRLPLYLAIAGLVAVPAAMDTAAATGAAVDFTPHRALYQLMLDHIRPGSGVSRAGGELAVEWRRACGGWTFEYRSVIDIGYSEGKPLRLHTSATTWEEAGGRNFRFSVRHEANGVPSEQTEGHARLEPDGSGSVTYSKPRGKRLTLPRGTLFPVAHSLDILRAARDGKPPVYLSRLVFDGMDAEGAYLVNAVIGKRTTTPGGPAALQGKPTWPVHVAYFRNSGAPAPSFEMGMRLFANGITDDLRMALDEITLRGRIHKLELLPSDCPD